jgi:16S rRNA A1518/A1519 N6-dimethyltransferase RsmA/KsgA/DIM1 with predicted DNA glycosylase/AP lyase activity
MLEVAKVGSDDAVYDLGCGDGRILFMAVNEFGAKKAVGYELDKHLCFLTSQEIKRQNREDKIKIVNGDLFEADISEATVITLYLTTLGNNRLKSKLTKQARPGTRIVSRSFKISGWIPSKTEYYSHSYIYLYKTPKAYLKMFNLVLKKQDN